MVAQERPDIPDHIKYHRQCFTCGEWPTGEYEDGSARYSCSHPAPAYRDPRGPLPDTETCPSCGGRRSVNQAVFLCQKDCINYRGYSPA
jgi:hypothetical protein